MCSIFCLIRIRVVCVVDIIRARQTLLLRHRISHIIVAIYISKLHCVEVAVVVLTAASNIDRRGNCTSIIHLRTGECRHRRCSTERTLLVGVLVSAAI